MTSLLGLKDSIGLSVAIAVVSCTLPFLTDGLAADRTVSFSLAAAWMCLTARAIFKYRWPGAWAFLGLPFALFWPGLDLFVWAACKWSPVRQVMIDGVEQLVKTGCI